MKATKITMWVLFALVLLSIVGTTIAVAAGVYTNGYESTRTRYVTVNDKVLKKNGGAQLVVEGDTEFKLKGAGWKAVDWEDYEIKIEANPACGLEFTANGQPCKYSDIDLTECFNVRRERGAFTISAGDYGVSTLLGKLYGEVHITSDTENLKMPYIMTVTPASGKAVQVLLDYVVEPEDITLNPSDGIITG